MQHAKLARSFGTEDGCAPHGAKATALAAKKAFAAAPTAATVASAKNATARMTAAKKAAGKKAAACRFAGNSSAEAQCVENVATVATNEAPPTSDAPCSESPAS